MGRTDFTYCPELGLFLKLVAFQILPVQVSLILRSLLTGTILSPFGILFCGTGVEQFQRDIWSVYGHYLICQIVRMK